MSKVHTYEWKDGKQETQKLTKAKAIRKYCLWCSDFSPTEVKMCNQKTCALFPFRLGNEKGLEIKQELTEEEQNGEEAEEVIEDDELFSDEDE